MPASAAFKMAAVDKPVVAWHCMCTGMLVSALRRVTNSNALYGFNKPAMSLMQIESAP